jgi:hypothetical protein
MLSLTIKLGRFFSFRAIQEMQEEACCVDASSAGRDPSRHSPGIHQPSQ